MCYTVKLEKNLTYRSVLHMKIFLRCLRMYPKESILAPLFKLLEACFDLCVPLVVAAIIDQGIGGGNATLVWHRC